VIAVKCLSRLFILAIAPLLLAALFMDDQPSFRPYEAPVAAPPAGAVPVTGRKAGERKPDLRNPVPPTAGSLAQGKALFEINCAMCHGLMSDERGRAGRKLTPPPPGLDRELLRSRSDAHIYNAVTFGFGRMPAFGDKLTPRERWDLVNHLRTRK
jgi:mono/diheme cytochrome c family protein